MATDEEETDVRKTPLTGVDPAEDQPNEFLDALASPHPSLEVYDTPPGVGVEGPAYEDEG